MNSTRHLSKGHTSILSPEFKYVPAAQTDLAGTFARIRGQLVQAQPAPPLRKRLGIAGDEPEFEIEVLEAAWLSR